MRLHPLVLVLGLACASGAAFAQAPHATRPGHHHSVASHEQARAHPRRTHEMGAGRYSPEVDLHSAARERRMDQAFADWQAHQRG